MQFCLLGPLMVHRDGVAVPIVAGKQRAVLAELLLNAGQVVGLDDLAETLWGTRPPPSARVTLQNYVRRLRKALGDEGPARISTQPGGYLIGVAAGELDLSLFRELLKAAQLAAGTGSWPAAAASAGKALALWRGAPLADTGSDVLMQREGPRLAEMRLAALEVRIEADLRLGGHAAVIAELRQMVGLHPLREQLHCLLMLALYRDGRQAEALAAYQQARDVVVAELGTEPGVHLRDLQRQILAADPVLAGPAPARPAGPNGHEPAVPMQLPGTVRHFTGRAPELAALDRLLDQPAALGAPLISVIGGTAGVGKTALAVHWARQVAGQFPDGQLYVNLRGYDSGPPLSAGEALAGFLRALGLPGPDIPARPAEQAAAYRSLLAGRRMLVLLDNAASVAQVRPLLPGTLSGMAVVTSRDALAGLVARDGAVRLELDLLPPAEAAGLLRALIGARAAADRQATVSLATLCARLPLALRVAAELATARPAVPLADLVAELADRQQRLDLLDAGGDLQTAVRAVFSWSCRQLPADTARGFRLAGLHPGADLDAYAAAALTGGPVKQARRLLDALARAHLIQPAGPGRYGLHDLLRGYAAGQAADRDGPAECRAALTRLLDHYLHTAAAAMDTLYPAERHRRPRITRPATPVPRVTEPAAARSWLDTQRSSLVAIAEHAAAHGWPAHATQLSATLFRYLNVGGHNPEATVVHTCAHRAARGAGDRAAEADALLSLGVTGWRQGQFRPAARYLRQALALYRRASDRDGETRALHNLGLIDLQQGRFPQATRYFTDALALYRETGNRDAEAVALSNLGLIDVQQGRYPASARYQRQALALFRQTGDQDGEAEAIANLGIVALRQGRYPQASRQLRQALTLYRAMGNPTGEANSLTFLGELALRTGRYPQAIGQLQRALTLFRAISIPGGEIEALNILGEALLAAGQPSQAGAQHAGALALARRIGDKYEQARAHHGLGRISHTAGDSGRARHHWQHALTLYTALGTPEADQLRASLHGPGPAT